MGTLVRNDSKTRLPSETRGQWHPTCPSSPPKAVLPRAARESLASTSDEGSGRIQPVGGLLQEFRGGPCRLHALPHQDHRLLRVAEGRRDEEAAAQLHEALLGCN